jgi:hypothetical protein
VTSLFPGTLILNQKVARKTSPHRQTKQLVPSRGQGRWTQPQAGSNLVWGSIPCLLADGIVKSDQ